MTLRMPPPRIPFVRLVALAMTIMAPNADGQVTRIFTPVPIAQGVADVKFGAGHCLLLAPNGEVLAAGRNDAGQLGTGDTVNSAGFVKVPIGQKVSAIATGSTQSYFIAQDRSLWGTGGNTYFNLGLDHQRSVTSPTKMQEDIVAVGAVANLTFTLDASGRLRASGFNGSTGVAGTGQSTLSTYFRTPANVADGVGKLVPWSSGSASHYGFISATGSLWGMGNNSSMQLLLPVDYNFVPVPIKMADGVVDAVVGASFSAFVRPDKTLWVAGLLSGSVSGPPQLVATGVSRVFAGDSHLLLLTERGELFGLGSSNVGQLGRSVSASRPVWIAGGVRAAAAAGSNSAFIDTAGVLWVMGDNTYGQLGTISERVPLLVEEPVPVAAQEGAGGFRLAMRATGVPQLTYQWFRGGNPVNGATSSEFVGTGALGEAGDYYCVASNRNGSVKTRTVAVVITPSAWISNLSVRTTLAQDQALIVGAVVRGGSNNILVRVAGPALNQFGLNGMPDPSLELYRDGSAPIAANDNWPRELASTFSAVGAFPFEEQSNDSAILQPLNGPMTIVARGSGAGTVLVETYAVTGGLARLVNISARNQIATDNEPLLYGFVIGGSGTRRVLVRAAGPALSEFGVESVVADPFMNLYDSAGRIVAGSDDWTPSLSTVFSGVGAFPFANGSKDAALVATLNAGAAYTVAVRGKPGNTGEVLVEIYEAP